MENTSPNSWEVAVRRIPSRQVNRNSFHVFLKFCLIPKKKAEINMPNRRVVALCSVDNICISMLFPPLIDSGQTILQVQSEN